MKEGPSTAQPRRGRGATFWTLVCGGSACAWIAFAAIGCFDEPRFARCMGTKLIVTLQLAEDFALVAVSVWLGVVAARQTGLAWLGWAAGIGLFFTLEAALVVLGLLSAPAR
jgi:hypothetical protein